jgi:hypothetical protein
MYTDFKAKSIYVLLNYNTILKAYCAWKRYYQKEKVSEAYDNVNIELLKPCVPKESNKFLSRDEIIDVEDQLYNWTDKAILECLWEGISGPSMNDLVGITEAMVRSKEKALYLPDGRFVKLTDKLYELLMKAFNETE